MKINEAASFQSPRVVGAKSTNHFSKEQRLSSPTMPTKMLWEDDGEPAAELCTTEWHFADSCSWYGDCGPLQ